MEQKLANLADTMFEAMEDISRVEEKMDKGIAEFEAIKSAVEAIKQAQEAQEKKNEAIEASLERLKKLEKNLNSIAGNDILKQLNQGIDKKILLKQEIAKYQKMILFILLVVLLGSVAFFWFGFMGNNFISTTDATVVFGGTVAFFIIALLVINSNLKAVISEEKITPKNAPQSTARDSVKKIDKKVDSTKLDSAKALVKKPEKSIEKPAEKSIEKPTEKPKIDSIEIKST